MQPMQPRGTDIGVSASITKRQAWIEIMLLAILVTLGIALRLRQYLFDRSLWHDEVSLAVNIINRDLLTLLSTPLAYNQSAPPGFLIATRLLVSNFGSQEWVLRLTPLLAGVLGVAIAVVLARRELRSTAARVTFVGLVALSPILVFYSSELKQYSSDALVSLCILTAASYRNAPYGSWLLTIVGFVGIVCSLPAVFVAAPVGVLMFYEALRSWRWRQVIAVAMAWGAGAALHLIYQLQAGMDRAQMIRGWHQGNAFAPFPPSSIADLLWYPRAGLGLIFLVFRQLDQAFPQVKPDWFDWLNWSLALVLLLSLAAVVASRHRIGLVAAGAIFTTLIAAVLELYPFSSRLLIFLAPATFFIIAVGFDELCRVSGTVVAGVAAALLLSVFVPPSVGIAREPRSYSDMRGALEQVKREFKDGDLIVVWRTKELYQYYAGELTSLSAPVLILDQPDRVGSLIKMIKSKGYQRVWFVSAHHVKLTKRAIEEIMRIGPMQFEWRAYRTIVMLLDVKVP
jgi:hypothetical protein